MKADNPGGRAPRRRFRKAQRLLRKKQFDTVFRQGRVVRDGYLSIHNHPNGLNFSRIGLVVSRKVGGAVRRNRVKRLFREAFRLNHEKLPQGFDFIMVPAPCYPDDSLNEVTERMLCLLNKLPRRAPGLGKNQSRSPETERAVL